MATHLSVLAWRIPGMGDPDGLPSMGLPRVRHDWATELNWVWSCSWHFTGGQRRRQWHPTPVLLPGKSHGQRSLVGCTPWGWKESDTTERLHFHFALSCIGEGNGNPLQCSWLENPRDGGSWWVAIYGVTQSWTWLKWLSSSSSIRYLSFSFWLTSLCIICSRFIHLIRTDSNAFLFMANIPLCICTTTSLFIHLSMDIYIASMF